MSATSSSVLVLGLSPAYTHRAWREVRERLQLFERLHFEGHTKTGADWKAALEAAIGPLRFDPVSWPLMRAIGCVSPVARSLCEMRYLGRTPHRLVGTRLTELIGEEPRTPFEVAVRPALDDIGSSRAARPVASGTSLPGEPA